MMTKRVNFYFKFILFTFNEDLQTFIQVVRIPAYISTIISAAAAAGEGPDEMTCSPAVVYTIINCPKYHRNRCVFMRTFPRKDVFISPYMRTFPKRGMNG